MKKKKFYQTRFISPYKGDKCTFTKLKNKSGVYIIKNNSGSIVYVGYSGFSISEGRKTAKGSLYKTAIRHFQSWEDSGQARATFNKKTHKIKFYLTNSGVIAQKLEMFLRKKLKPTDNPQDLPKYYAPPDSVVNLYNDIKNSDFINLDDDYTPF